MKEVSKYGLFVVFLLGLSPVLRAQDLIQALTDMRREYEQATSLHVVMQVAVYDDTLSTQPYFSARGEVKKERDNYRYAFGGMEMLMNQDYLLLVDQESQTIVCNYRDLQAEATFNQAMPFSVDSILSFYEDPIYLGRKGENDHYSIVQKSGPVEKILLLMHAESYQLKSMAYYYREGQYVEIEFQVFDKAPAFRPGTFDEKDFVTKDKAGFKPTSRFAGYQVVEPETY